MMNEANNARMTSDQGAGRVNTSLGNIAAGALAVVVGLGIPAAAWSAQAQGGASGDAEADRTGTTEAVQTETPARADEPLFVHPGHSMRPLRTYAGVNQSLRVDVAIDRLREMAAEAGGNEASDAEVRLEVVVAGTEVDGQGAAQPGETLTTRSVGAGNADASGVARVDLAELFPVIWSRRGEEATGVLYVQARVGERRVGAPLVVEPQVRPGRYLDGVSGRMYEAVMNPNVGAEQLNEFIAQVTNLGPRMVQRLLGEVVPVDEPQDTVSGVRMYQRQDVVLETSLGTVVFRLRPDEAPETSYRIAELAGGGWYDGVIFHRIVPDNGRGAPFVIQGGDPTGTGAGGPAFSIDFEPSDLPHDFGVVSMARQGNDPNSNGSQFFICLSREGTRALDGGYIAFGEVVEGGDVVAEIASVPLGDTPQTSQQPLNPPVIQRGSLRPSAPIGERSRVSERPIGADRPVRR